MRAPLLAVAFLGAIFAGCLGGDDDARGDQNQAGPDLSALSPKLFDVLPVEITWVASSIDGQRIHNAVYRPNTDDPVPVFINFSPYWGDTAEAEGDHFSQYMIHEYVPRGYAVVLSAVRGTGHSEGCFQIGGDLELQDTYDVVDHFAAQPWSNGNVGAGGKSYDSTTQNGMIAKFPHPALKTLFHVSGITDVYRYNYRNGVELAGTGGLFNTRYYFQGTNEYGIGYPPTGADPAFVQDEDPESMARIVDDAACAELPETAGHGWLSAEAGAKTDYWIERDWNRFVGDSSAVPSIFFVHGLQDWNVKPDHILPWLDALPDDVVVKAWLHQWSRDPDLGGEGGHVYPMRDDWNVTMLRWLDHWLKGIDTGMLEEPLFDVQGTDAKWRHMPTWPPHEDATTFDLATEPTEVELPLDTTPVRISGVPLLRVTAASNHADPVLTATLLETNGTEREWLSEAVLRAVYRNGLEEPEPIAAGAAVDYVLEFYPLDVVIEAGHGLMITVGGAPVHASPKTGQLDGVTYQMTSFEATFVPAEARENQPTFIDCFAC